MRLPTIRRGASLTRSRTGKIIVLDVAIAVAVLGSIGWAIYGNDGKQSAKFDCAQMGQRHRVAVVDDRFTPETITVQRCDSLTISNQGSLAFNLNFGARNQHQIYPGYSAKTLLPNESLTIDAFVAGEFVLHDHFRDNAKLRFIVRD
jgi:hypothetical protein